MHKRNLTTNVVFFIALHLLNELNQIFFFLPLLPSVFEHKTKINNTYLTKIDSL